MISAVIIAAHFPILYDNGKEGFNMKTVFKILMFPIVLVIDLFTWICCGLLSCSAFVFTLTSSLLAILAIAVLLTYSVTNGLILLTFAFLASPMGVPMIATWVLSGLQSISLAIKRI